MMMMNGDDDDDDDNDSNDCDHAFSWLMDAFDYICIYIYISFDHHYWDAKIHNYTMNNIA